MRSPNPTLWYKDTIIYEVHVKAFFDANNDGIGDFQGLAQKLDYLCDLGIGTIWLLPFYPSPLKDDGYDISDYRSINPAYGTMRDFRAFLHAAHDRGLRVITELVINHTSDQHPWFQRARRARPGSVARDYYVWSDTDQRYKDARIIFTDTEKSNWTWDPVANAYYWHRFFLHQPDLNFDNPRVVDEVIRIMRYWLDMGVDGLRLDAIPYLIEREGTDCENLPETHEVIKKLRAAMEASHPDRMLLAEANQWPEDVLPYFGNGDVCHMAFHFPLMPRIYMAIAQEDRFPVTDIMRQTPEIPETCQWAIFLRNHDELTLEMVTASERDYLWKFYAQEMRARLNIGIRRRLLPLMENDRRRVELLYSLLMSMPGTPIIYYGDEIGMGDNVFLGDRDGVRTPMQWTPDRNGGFSRVDPARIYLPPIQDAIFGYQARNVEAQSADPSSLLNWLKRLITVRRRHSLFGRGRFRFLYPGNRKVLAYLREDDTEVVLCIANLSRAPQPVELDLAEFKGRVPVELLGRSPFPPIGELAYFITLAGHGFYWFILAQEAEAPSWHETPIPHAPELQTLVLPKGPANLTDGPAYRHLLERILPEFMALQRWFGAKGDKIKSIQEATRCTIEEGGASWPMPFFEVAFAHGEPQRYSLPLAIKWGERGEEGIDALLPWTIARVRHRARLGILIDATADEDFVRGIVRRMRAAEDDDTSKEAHLSFWQSAILADAPGVDDLDSMPIVRMGREQTNTSVRIAETMILKFYRKLQAGQNPEIEIGRHLTDVARFANAPPMLGTLEYVEADGTRTALAILQGYIRNQGDGWTYAVDTLNRMLNQAEVSAEFDVLQDTGLAAFLAQIRTLGRRTAELHRAFAIETDDPSFALEKVTKKDLKAARARAHEEAEKALRALRDARGRLSGDAAEAVDRLQKRAKEINRRLNELLPDELEIVKTRCHGDYHLGQVVRVSNDFYILDFEGEPVRALEERRAKQLPLIDIAGMLRSFDYATWVALFKRSDLEPKIQEKVMACAQHWQRAANQEFLAGYEEAIGDCPSYPGDRETACRIIQFFALEKALYEISYEATHRPDWLPIPIRGVERLLDADREVPWQP